MEFPGIGVVPYEPMDASLKPFVRRKQEAAFKFFSQDSPEDFVLIRSELMQQIDFFAGQYPKEEQAEQRQKRIRFWDFTVFFGRDNITGKDFVNEWVNNRVFAPAKARQRLMETYKDLLDAFFDNIDQNKNGVIEYDEYDKWLQRSLTVSDEIKKKSFETLDADKDGVLSREEFKYGMIYWAFCSPPGSPFNNILGPFKEED